MFWNLFIAIILSGLTYQVRIMTLASTVFKLEDLTVLKRSPELLNNVKIGQDQLYSL